MWVVITAENRTAEIQKLIQELGGPEQAVQALQQLQKSGHVVAFDLKKAAKLALLLAGIGITIPMFVSDPHVIEQQDTQTVSPYTGEANPHDLFWGHQYNFASGDTVIIAEEAKFPEDINEIEVMPIEGGPKKIPITGMHAEVVRSGRGPNRRPGYLVRVHWEEGDEGAKAMSDETIWVDEDRVIGTI